MSHRVILSHVNGVTNPESSFSCVRVIRSRVLESRNGLPQEKARNWRTDSPVTIAYNDRHHCQTPSDRIRYDRMGVAGQAPWRNAERRNAEQWLNYSKVGGGTLHFLPPPLSFLPLPSPPFPPLFPPVPFPFLSLSSLSSPPLRSRTLSSRRLLEWTITMTPIHLGPSPTMGSR